MAGNPEMCRNWNMEPISMEACTQITLSLPLYIVIVR